MKLDGFLARTDAEVDPPGRPAQPAHAVDGHVDDLVDVGDDAHHVAAAEHDHQQHQQRRDRLVPLLATSAFLTPLG